MDMVEEEEDGTKGVAASVDLADMVVVMDFMVVVSYVYKKCGREEVKNLTVQDYSKQAVVNRYKIILIWATR